MLPGICLLRRIVPASPRNWGGGQDFAERKLRAGSRHDVRGENQYFRVSGVYTELSSWAVGQHCAGYFKSLCE